MNKEEILKKLREVGTLEDDVARRDILSELEQELTKTFDETETFKTTSEQLKEDNEKLREANMKLFLRVGDTKTAEERKKESTGIEEEEEPEPRKFEDLFDEKGGIK